MFTEKMRVAAHSFVLNSDTKVLGNKTEAYKTAYNTKDMQQSTIIKKAWELFNHPEVMAEILKLQQEKKKNNEIHVDWISEEIRELIVLAKGKDDLRTGLQGLLALAKLHGLITDYKHVEHTEVLLNKDRQDVAKRFAKRFAKRNAAMA